MLLKMKEIKMSSLSFPVLKVQQPIGDFFIASLSAKEVLSICEKDVRRLAEEQRDFEKYLGIQRPVDPKRTKEIREYVSKVDATFPTTIILSVNQKCAELIETANGVYELNLTPFVSEDDYDENIEMNKIARVLDGQHRLAGFTEKDEQKRFDFVKNYDGNFDLTVAFFIGADLPRQANIFARVNLAQTKVNKSLVYDLLELEQNRSPLKTCHEIAKALDSSEKSPFYRRIKRLGVKTNNRENETITQAAFVESLVKFISPKPEEDRNDILKSHKLKWTTGSDLKKHPFRNMFINGRDTDITLIILNYFNAVKKRWPEAWKNIDKMGNILPRSNAFLALMRFLHQHIYQEIIDTNGADTIPSVSEFGKFLEDLELNDEDFTSSVFKPGSSGQADFYKFLIGSKTRADLLEF